VTRLLMMGPPGSGKGTQAGILADRFGIPAISTGDIFRANVRDGTRLGKEAERYMKAGDYVPDEVTNGMVRDRLDQPDVADGFVLDGYPRTLAQVEYLDDVLADQQVKLDRVVELAVDVEEVVARLLARAAAEGRDDDDESVIRRRQHLYASETKPLIRVYADRGLLSSVNGQGTVDDVAGRIAAALGAPG
jgi:adenylate kinase